MGFVGNQKAATDAFQKVKNQIYFALDKRNESVNEGKLGDTWRKNNKKGFVLKVGNIELKSAGPSNSHDILVDRMPWGTFMMDYEAGGDDWWVKPLRGKDFWVDSIDDLVKKIKGDSRIKESVNEAFNVRDLPTWLFDDPVDFEDWYEDGMKLDKGKGKLAPFSSSDEKKLFQLVGIWQDSEGDYQFGRGDYGTGKTTGARSASYTAQDDIKKFLTQKGKVVDESLSEAKYPTDLKVGSVIMGQGFTRLKGIDGGKYYKIVAMDDATATLVPSDKSGNVKGSSKVRHKLDSIEGGIKTAKRGDENGIVVIKESVNEGWASGPYVGLEMTPTGPKLVKTFSSGSQAYAWVMKAGGGHSIMTKKQWNLEESITEGKLGDDCGCNENHDCGCGGVHEHKHIHEDLSADANGIAGLTASRASAVKGFLEKNNIDSNKLYLFLKKGNLKDRMDFVTALVGKPGNPIQKKVISQFSK